jgi:hypothetical protein
MLSTWLSGEWLYRTTAPKNLNLFLHPHKSYKAKPIFTIQLYFDFWILGLCYYYLTTRLMLVCYYIFSFFVSIFFAELSQLILFIIIIYYYFNRLFGILFSLHCYKFLIVRYIGAFYRCLYASICVSRAFISVEFICFILIC